MKRNAIGVAAVFALVTILTSVAIFFAYREREDKRRFDEATISLERQLLRADLEIAAPERAQGRLPSG